MRAGRFGDLYPHRKNHQTSNQFLGIRVAVEQYIIRTLFKKYGWILPDNAIAKLYVM